MGCPDLLVTVDQQSLIPILGDRSLAVIPYPGCTGSRRSARGSASTSSISPGKLNDAPNCMSRLYGDKDDEVINLEEVDMLLDVDKLSDTELGAAINACHIASVDECYTRGVGRCPEDD